MKRFTNLLRSMVAVLVMVVALTLITTTDVDAASKKTLKVTNLPSNTVTIKKNKTFKLKTNYAASKVRFTTSKAKIARVSSKGVIKGVNKGKAQITITLKADKKVKTKINVIVGTPVSKVSISKTSMTLVTGGAATLKATVAGKTASNKKVIWSSSDPKIATVSSTGKVTAVKAGTVTITATAADGSGKKAGCKVTVAAPVKVVGTTIVNPQTIQIKLSAAQTLGKSDFNVKAKYMINGSYKRNLKIDSVSTKDKINYTIKLDTQSKLAYNQLIRIEVMHLSVTGTQAVETVYSEGGFIQTYYYSPNYVVGGTIEYDLSIDGIGYSDITVTGLPEGITYKVYQDNTDSYDYIYFSGSVKKEGTYTSTVKMVDELGNTFIYYLTWHIISDNSLSAYAAPVNTAIFYSDYASVDSPIRVYGGSGEYSFSIVGNTYGLTVSDSGRLQGSIGTPGVYKVNVLVKDKNKPALTKTVTCTVNVEEAVTVSGIVKDKKGLLIPSASIRFVNKDKKFEHSRAFYDDADNTAVYSVRIVPGTYDIQVTIGNSVSWIYDKRITGNISGLDITTDILKVAVATNNQNITAFSLGSWLDEDEEYYGTGGYIYVTPGTYKLTSTSNIYKGTINATITDATKTVTAAIAIRDDTVNVTDNSVTDVKTGNVYKFTATQTGTYYIYSSSTSDPAAKLYDGTGVLLKYNDDGGSNIVGSQDYDFYIEYNLQAGKTYYVAISRNSCTLHITTTKPETN